MKHKIIFLIFTLASFTSWGQTKRQIELEWAPIKGSVGYQLELFSIRNKKSFSLGITKTEEASWSKELKPGVYEIRTRSLDYRNVPSKWSKRMRFTVQLPTPEIIMPLEGETLTTNEFKKALITFKWRSVVNAQTYYLEVWNIDTQKTMFTEKINANEKQLNLPVAANYSWRIVALAAQKTKISPRVSGKKFKIKGGILSTPKVKIKIRRKRAQLYWTPPPYANFYNFTLYKKTSFGLRETLNKNEYKKSKLTIKKKGEYRLSIKATASGFGNSPSSHVEFIWDGKKARIISLKNEDITSSENSSQFALKRWQLLGAIDFPTLTYQGIVSDTATPINDNLSGGQRYLLELHYEINNKLMVGAQFSNESYRTTTANWKFLTLNNSLAYLFQWSKFKLKTGVGFFYKETPYVSADKANGTYNRDKISSLGPSLVFGADYIFNHRWILMADSTWFLHMIGQSTPNNKKLSSTMSRETNFWLALAYDQFVNVRIGLALITYESAFKSIASSGEDNEGKATGAGIKFGVSLRF